MKNLILYSVNVYVQANIPKVLCFTFKWLPQFHRMNFYLISFNMDLVFNHIVVSFFFFFPGAKIISFRKIQQIMPSTIKHF